jgi:virulence-associated protein VagC
MKTTEVFQNGDSQVVQFPAGFQFTSDAAAIRRQGNAVILELIKSSNWFVGFFEWIRIRRSGVRTSGAGRLAHGPSHLDA